MERKLRCKKRCNRYSILGCNTEKGQNIVRVMNGNFKNDLHEVSLRKFKGSSQTYADVSGMPSIKMMGSLYTRI